MKIFLKVLGGMATFFETPCGERCYDAGASQVALTAALDYL